MATDRGIARKNKSDEFYTQLPDIEKELNNKLNEINKDNETKSKQEG